MGKTTVILDEDLIREAMKITGAKTKKNVIEISLSELVKKSKIKKLKESLGRFEIDLSYEDLMRQRNER